MKHKADRPGETYLRGGDFDFATHKSQLELATVVTLGAIAMGLLINASSGARENHEDEQPSEVPSQTVDYYPGDDEASLVAKDLAHENDGIEVATYVVDTSKHSSGN